jgi:hypothetical protein
MVCIGIFPDTPEGINPVFERSFGKGAATASTLASSTETVFAVTVQPQNFMPGVAWQLNILGCEMEAQRVSQVGIGKSAFEPK